jgi:hypothetical protein
VVPAGRSKSVFVIIHSPLEAVLVWATKWRPVSAEALVMSGVRSLTSDFCGLSSTESKNGHKFYKIEFVFA